MAKFLSNFLNSLHSIISLYNDKQNVLSCHLLELLNTYSAREYSKIGKICEQNIFRQIEMIMALTNSRCSINFLRGTKYYEERQRGAAGSKIRGRL